MSWNPSTQTCVDFRFCTADHDVLVSKYILMGDSFLRVDHFHIGSFKFHSIFLEDLGIEPKCLLIC